MLTTTYSHESKKYKVLNAHRTLITVIETHHKTPEQARDFMIRFNGMAKNIIVIPA